MDNKKELTERQLDQVVGGISNPHDFYAARGIFTTMETRPQNGMPVPDGIVNTPAQTGQPVTLEQQQGGETPVPQPVQQKYTL